jgi:DedD protein
MDQNIKNRLVGIIVIFALAVIFLPMILDGSGVDKQKLEVVIPPQPIVNANPEFEAKITQLNKQAEAVPDLETRFVDENSAENTILRETDTNATAPSEPAAKSEADAKPVQTETDLEPIAKTGGDSWVLQVGSFKDRGKALAQRDKVRKSNIAAVFIEQFNTDDNASFRVRLGPFINREQTRVAQNKIKAKHDIDGIIMKYER